MACRGIYRNASLSGRHSPLRRVFSANIILWQQEQARPLGACRGPCGQQRSRSLLLSEDRGRPIYCGQRKNMSFPATRGFSAGMIIAVLTFILFWLGIYPATMIRIITVAMSSI